IAQGAAQHRGEMRLQAAARVPRCKRLRAEEQRERKHQVGLGQIAGMPHSPALQRAVLQDLEIEAGIGQEYSEPEVYRSEIRERLDLIRLAGWPLRSRREQIVGELMGECRDETVGSLQ